MLTPRSVSGSASETTSVEAGSRKRTFVLMLGLVLIWTLPSLMLSYIQYANEFLHIPHVRVAASMDASHLLPLSFSGFYFMVEHHGGELIALVLSRITGLSIQQLSFIPVGGLLVPVLYYILCRKLGISKTVAALLALAIALDPTVVMTDYNVALYAWTRSLLLVFLLLYTKILHRKTASLVLLLFVIFIGTYVFYWTDPVLMISFSIFVNIAIAVSLFVGQNRSSPKGRVLTLSIAVAFLVVYLGFGNMIYRTASHIAGMGALEQMGSSIMALSTRILQLLGRAQPNVLGLAQPDVETYYAAASPPVVNQMQMLRYVVMGIPIACLLVKEVIRILKTRSIRRDLDPASIVLWSLVGVLLTHMLVYSAYGHASTRYIALLGPMMAVIALDKCDVGHRLKTAFAAVLVLLAVPAFLILYRQATDRATFADVRPAANWLMRNSEDRLLLADLGIYGMFAVEAASEGDLFNYRSFTSTSFENLVGAVPESDMLDTLDAYIIVDKKNTVPVVSGGWGYFEPLSNHLDEIDRNVQVNEIYDNGTLSILVPSH